MRSLALLVALGFWWSVPSSNPFCTISTFANSVAASEPFARNRDADVAPALLKGIMGQIAGSQLNDSGTVYVPLQNPTEHFRYVNSVHVLHENLRELFLQNSVVNLEDVRQFLQLHYPSYLQDQLSALFDLLRSTDSSSKQSFIAKKDLLIVVNTKNRLYLTVILLKYLRGFQKFADLIIIDDHSADGSIDYLERKGYAVYRKHQTRGVWHSWRIGYKLAASMRYKCVVFIDQTIMISSQAVYNLIQNVLAKDDVRFHIPMISSANPFSPQVLLLHLVLTRLHCVVQK